MSGTRKTRMTKKAASAELVEVDLSNLNSPRWSAYRDIVDNFFSSQMQIAEVKIEWASNPKSARRERNLVASGLRRYVIERNYDMRVVARVGRVFLARGGND